MTPLSICLIIVGIVAIGISYLISDKVAEEKMKKKAEEIILSTDSKEILIQQTKETVDEILENLSDDVTVSVERELEKLSNEKIMAVHDYSETVLNEINKNHNEVMFLYSMLDDKDKEIKKTVREVRDTIKAAKQIEIVENNEPKLVEVSDVVEDTTTSDSVKESLYGLEPETISEFVTDNTKDKKELILKLNKDGYTNLEIAKKLKMGVGEVKLILGLFQGANK